MCRSAFFLNVLFALGAGSMASAGPVEPYLQNAVATLIQQGSPGVAIALVVDGKTYFANAGTTGPGGEHVTKRTIFETASLSKVLTTTLLGLDVARGQKSLKDRAEDFLPGIHFHRRFRPATLQMLANFQAGLPDAPPDYERIDPEERGLNHYSVQRFLKFARRWIPRNRLPAPRVYSDSSVGLLGLCLGDGHFGEWERRLKGQVCAPLGMVDTTVTLNGPQTKRLAVGLKNDGTVAPRWPVHAIAAGDGVKSSSADLARFLTALLGVNPRVPDDLARGITIATDTRYPFDNGLYLQALSWEWERLNVSGQDYWIIQKTGGIPGVATQIIFSRELGIGVVILASRQGASVRRVSQDLIRELALHRSG